MARLIQLADRMNIERVFIYMGEKWSRNPAPEDFRKQNDDVIQALSHWHHRAFGFVYINPKFVRESLDEINRCIRDGPMVGVKLWVAHKCNAPELDPIVERAAELKALVFQHAWFNLNGYEPG